MLGNEAQSRILINDLLTKAGWRFNNGLDKELYLPANVIPEWDIKSPDGDKTYRADYALTNYFPLSTSYTNYLNSFIASRGKQAKSAVSIAGYQKVIEGCNMVIENYKPTFKIDPSWENVRLGEVCETFSGGTPARDKKEYYENRHIPWLKSGELNKGEIFNTEEKITSAALNNSSAKVVPSNSVLVALYGATVGVVGISRIETAINQANCAGCPRDELIPEYLCYYLLPRRNELIALSSGGAQQNISQAKLREFIISIPPPEKQKIIINGIMEQKQVIESLKTFKANLQIKIASLIESL